MRKTSSARRTSGFIEPCLPTPGGRGASAPTGPDWIHEVKYDGYRMQVVRERDRVRLFTRNGHDWSKRFPAVTVCAALLPVSSFVIDGELVCCDDEGMPDFERLRSGQHDLTAFVYAFDLLELGGVDLRPHPIEERKRSLEALIRPVKGRGIAYVEHCEEDGPTLFKHACKLGLEGIVSKRKGSRYVSGRSNDWRKAKNPKCAAVKREEEEDWGKRSRRSR